MVYNFMERNCGMKKRNFFAAVILIFMSGLAISNAQLTVSGLRFGAPAVDGRANVHDPEAGDIILDASDSTFYGRTDSGSWTSLGGSASVVPPGAILPFGGSSAPVGFLIADGSAVSRSTYADLFVAIGTAFGNGDGSTTFNLPDLRGRFLRGVDDGAGNDPDASTRSAMNPGGNTQDNVGSIQSDAFQGHYHTTNAANTSTAGSGAFVTGTGSNAVSSRAIDPVSDGTHGTPRTASETRPKNANVNFIIKI